MNDEGQLVLLEPQDFFGTKGKKLIKYEGSEQVYEYFKRQR